MPSDSGPRAARWRRREAAARRSAYLASLTTCRQCGAAGVPADEDTGRYCLGCRVRGRWTEEAREAAAPLLVALAEAGDALAALVAHQGDGAPLYVAHWERVRRAMLTPAQKLTGGAEPNPFARAVIVPRSPIY